MRQRQKGIFHAFLLICYLSNTYDYRFFEPFFRAYLSRLVDACPFPLKVIYTPAKSLHLHSMCMHSPAKSLPSAPPPTLEIQPLTPQFYINILKYSDAKLGFATEMENLPHIADPVSQRLWASDPTLLHDLARSGKALLTSEEDQNCSTSIQHGPPVFPASYLPWLQTSVPKTFMDAFTDSSCSTGMRRKYRAARVHCYLMERFAWGSCRLAAIYGYLVRMAVMWLLWRGLSWMLYNSAVGSIEGVLMVSGICFVGARMWAALIDSYYR